MRTQPRSKDPAFAARVQLTRQVLQYQGLGLGVYRVQGLGIRGLGIRGLGFRGFGIRV